MLKFIGQNYELTGHLLCINTYRRAFHVQDLFETFSTKVMTRMVTSSFPIEKVGLLETGYNKLLLLIEAVYKFYSCDINSVVSNISP